MTILTPSAAAQAKSDLTGLIRAARGTMRVGNSDNTFSYENGTSGAVPSYGNERFAGNGGASAVTAVGAVSNEFG